jgi:isopentenyl-diphosphate delta-isomerase
VRAANPVTQKVAMTFRDWGIPTALSVAAVRQSLSDASLVATGGMRDGLMVAKALGLGATMCGIGLPLLRAALSNEASACEQVVDEFIRGLKIAMMCSGSRTVADLTEHLHVTDGFRGLMSQYTTPRALRPNTVRQS